MSRHSEGLRLCCFCLAENVLTHQPPPPFLAQLFHVLICFLRVSSDIHTRSCSYPEDLMAHWVIVLSQQDLTTRTQEDFVLTHSVKLAHLCVSKL